MKFTVYNINNMLMNLRSKILNVAISYASAIIIEIITESKSLYDFIIGMISFSRLAVLLMWVLLFSALVIWITSIVTDCLRKKQSPSANFMRIMNEHTDPVLAGVGQSELSWGYNKNIHRCKDPIGWKPDAFYVSVYEDNSEYRFPSVNNELPGYTNEEFQKFYFGEEMRKCREKKNDKERFSALRIEPNYNDQEKRVEVQLQKTKWSALQFSWGYFRRIDDRNHAISEKDNLDCICKKIQDAFLNSESVENFIINSFCLHLILETKDGKAVLARVSKNKGNDYPSTWAATIGEQINKEDFYDSLSNGFRDNFVLNWTKRALKEEFDITETESALGSDLYVGTEYDEFVDEKSLRILSVDMEGDIYNIALTCVIRLRLTLDELKKQKGIWMDSEESTELRSCDLSEIRKILLQYPNNSDDYHPSTYLRLLMFHLYKTGITEMCKAFCDDEKKYLKK